MTDRPPPPPADQVEAAQVLEPCKFCGGTPYDTTSVNGSQMRYIGCSTCGYSFKAAWGCMGPPGVHGWSKDLPAAWNRRPVTGAAPEGMREATLSVMAAVIESDPRYDPGGVGGGRFVNAAVLATRVLAALPPASGSDRGPVARRPSASLASPSHESASEPSNVACGGIIHASEDQFERLMASIEAEKRASVEEMPTERDALKVLHQAYSRLTDLGWNDAIYCPKDGTVFDAIEAGSTGVHDCIYEGEWPKGRWWALDGDMWPSRPILWRPKAVDGSRHLSSDGESEPKAKVTGLNSETPPPPSGDK